MFDADEESFLRSQGVARLATVSPVGQCDADVVEFALVEGAFLIGGHNLSASRRYRNIAAGGDKVSLIVDEPGGADQRAGRGIKVYGIAAIESRDGPAGRGEYIVIRPQTSWIWGIGTAEPGGKPRRKKTHGEGTS